MFVGVDVHETHVSAALLDGGCVRAVVRVGASSSPSGGVFEALSRLVADDGRARDALAVTVSRSMDEASLMTPDRLARTACIRLCPSEAVTAPPMAGWPADLRAAVGDQTYLCGGGHEFDGRAARPLDEGELARIADDLAARNLGVAAVTSVFAPVNSAAELAAAAFLSDRLPGLRVCLSHEIGSLGLFERENATIMNAALLPEAERIAGVIADEVASVMARAGVYLAHNDGTVMELALARRYPVLGLWSGRASAINGAAALSGHDDAVVVDAREDATYVGRAVGGYPRQARHDVEVAGIPMSLHHPEFMPALPVRAGGGRDIEALERAVVRADPGRRLPVVLVGSGAASIPTSFRAERVELGHVAGAVGAAQSPIGSEVDCILSGDPTVRAAARRNAELLAMHKAVMAGAVDRTVRIHEVEEIPLGYLPGDVVRLRVKAIGGRE